MKTGCSPELEDMKECFKSLHFHLVHKGHRQNIPELLNMLDILLEAGEITRTEYAKWTDEINGYTECGTSKRIRLGSNSQASDESETGFDMDESIPKNVSRIYRRLINEIRAKRTMPEIQIASS